MASKTTQKQHRKHDDTQVPRRHGGGPRLRRAQHDGLLDHVAGNGGSTATTSPSTRAAPPARGRRLPLPRSTTPSRPCRRRTARANATGSRTRWSAWSDASKATISSRAARSPLASTRVSTRGVAGRLRRRASTPCSLCPRSPTRSGARPTSLSNLAALDAAAAARRSQTKRRPSVFQTDDGGDDGPPPAFYDGSGRSGRGVARPARGFSAAAASVPVVVVAAAVAVANFRCRRAAPRRPRP